METTKDMKVTLGVFALMCLAVAANLFFMQTRRFSAVVPPSQHAVATPNAGPISVPNAPPVQVGTATQETSTSETAQNVVKRSESGLASSGSVEPVGAPGEFPMSRQEIVRGVQRGLANRGYGLGTADGVAGTSTRAAIMAYEFDNGLVLTAEPTRELMQHILVGASGPAAARRGAVEVKGGEALALMKSVKEQLNAAGYAAGKTDGTYTAQLKLAIQNYEAGQKLPVTGRISAPLVAKLLKPATAGKTAAR